MTTHADGDVVGRRDVGSPRSSVDSLERYDNIPTITCRLLLFEMLCVKLQCSRSRAATLLLLEHCGVSHTTSRTTGQGRSFRSLPCHRGGSSTIPERHARIVLRGWKRRIAAQFATICLSASRRRGRRMRDGVGGGAVGCGFLENGTRGRGTGGVVLHRPVFFLTRF